MPTITKLAKSSMRPENYIGLHFFAPVEDIPHKASLKRHLRTHRCVIIADGFYDWKTLSKKGRTPYRFFLPGNELFAIAGLWDVFENDQGEGDGESSDSAWSYIMKQESLRWGFWVLIISLLLYAIFEAKRTQRIIPVVKPLPNTTLDFTNTVGRLYFQQADQITFLLYVLQKSLLQK